MILKNYTQPLEKKLERVKAFLATNPPYPFPLFSEQYLLNKPHKAEIVCEIQQMEEILMAQKL